MNTQSQAGGSAPSGRRLIGAPHGFAPPHHSVDPNRPAGRLLEVARVGTVWLLGAHILYEDREERERLKTGVVTGRTISEWTYRRQRQAWHLRLSSTPAASLQVRGLLARGYRLILAEAPSSAAGARRCRQDGHDGRGVAQDLFRELGFSPADRIPVRAHTFPAPDVEPMTGLAPFDYSEGWYRRGGRERRDYTGILDGVARTHAEGFMARTGRPSEDGAELSLEDSAFRVSVSALGPLEWSRKVAAHCPYATQALATVPRTPWGAPFYFGGSPGDFHDQMMLGFALRREVRDRLWVYLHPLVYHEFVEGDAQEDWRDFG